MTLEADAPPRIRTMIVEDQGMVRAFLERWVGGLPRFMLVASSRSGEEALEKIPESRPDLILVDYQLPGMDGLEFIRAARQLRPQFRALVLTSVIDPLSITRIRESGAEGYLEKDAPPELLTEAIESLANGAHYYSRHFIETMSREGLDAEGIGKILSRREQQVLTHVLARMTSREIAEVMNLSARTVEFHRANLMTKLNAKNLKELTAIAQLRGWSVR